MQKIGVLRRTAWTAGLGLALLGGFLAADPVANAPAASPAALTGSGGYPGNTVPSKHLTKLTFSYMGVIERVNVKRGDRVKAQQELMAQDTAEEEKELEALKVEAESDLPVKAAEVNRDTKKVEMERIQKMFATNVATDLELEEAKLNAETARLQYEKAKQDQFLAKLKMEKQALRIQKMKLLSPFDGIVERVELQPGEVVDPQKPVLTLVTNNPLWVEVHLPQSVAGALQQGKTKLRVRYENEKPEQAREALVIYLAPLADAASDTQLVGLEMPNPEGVESGKNVIVDVPQPLTQAPPAPPAAQSGSGQ